MSSAHSKHTYTVVRSHATQCYQYFPNRTNCLFFQSPPSPESLQEKCRFLAFYGEICTVAYSYSTTTIPSIYNKADISDIFSLDWSKWLMPRSHRQARIADTKQGFSIQYLLKTHT